MHQWLSVFNKIFAVVLVLTCAILGAGVAPVMAQSDSFKWSLSPIIGVHSPVLEQLNEEAFKAPLVGFGTIRGEPDSPTAGESFEIPFGFDNDLDDIGLNANVGLEFQWVQSTKHIFLMGLSTWEGFTQNTVPAQVPLQGELRDTDYDRRGKMSYNEFYLGWKYNFFSRPNRYRFYTRATLNELFDIDFREEHVFSINGGDLDGVKRIIVVKGQTTGTLMMQLGFGGEYFLKKNISVGLEAGYLFSYRPFQLVNTSSDDDLQLGDDVTFHLPIQPASRDSPLGNIPADTDPSQDWTDPLVPFPTPRDMDLRFDGWKAAFRITVYY